MFRVAICISAGLASIVMSSSSLAQNIFDDNVLRTELIELAEQIVDEEQRLASMSNQMNRLDTELKALRALIMELQKTNGKLDGKNQEREKQLSEIAGKLDKELSGAQRHGEDLLYRLEAVLSGIDAQEFRKAIDGYKSSASPEETKKILKGIQALGELSNFAAPALFWNGLIEYETGEMMKAREMLTEYLERYPVEQHAPNAMLLLANIAAENKDLSQSKWEDLILDLYPASTAAKVVREQRSL